MAQDLRKKARVDADLKVLQKILQQADVVKGEAAVKEEDAMDNVGGDAPAPGGSGSRPPGEEVKKKRKARSRKIRDRINRLNHNTAEEDQNQVLVDRWSRASSKKKRAKRQELMNAPMG